MNIEGNGKIRLLPCRYKVGIVGRNKIFFSLFSTFLLNTSTYKCVVLKFALDKFAFSKSQFVFFAPLFLINIYNV